MLSFTSFGIGNLRDWFSADFIGFDNYTKLVDDETFQKAARNTLVFVVFGVPLTLALGLLAALGLNQALGRVQGLFRVGYYLPVVTSIVAIAVIWRYLLHPDYGLVNAMLGKVGIDPVNWLGDSSTALGSIIALGVWRNFGFDMVIFLAALQGINPALYEAARSTARPTGRSSAASRCRCSSPAILFLAIITSSGYLQLFEEPFVMTGGGPLNSTLSVSMYVYQQGFSFLQPRLRERGRVRALRRDPRARRDPVPVAALGGHGVSTTLEAHARHRRRRCPRRAAGGSALARRWWLSSRCSWLGLVVTIVPFLWMLLGSLKTQRELLQRRRRCCPRTRPPTNYERLWDRLDFPRYFWNSTFIAVADHALEPALLLDGRLRAREAALRRPQPALPARARDAARAGRRDCSCRSSS